MIKLLSQLMHQYVNGSSNPWGEVHRRHSVERMPGEHKLHGWTVGTIANVSCWGGWEWIMHVLGKQLPHSNVEGGGKKVGVGGTFLIKLAFLINIIVCRDPEATVWQENNVQISKREPVTVIWTHKKGSLDAKIIFYVGRRADIHKWNQSTQRNVSRLHVLLIRYCLDMPEKWMLHLSWTTLSNYC